MNKKLIFAACFLSAGLVLSAQEALKSVEEEYYDFLVLDGVTERPALNYRTMSNSIWTIREDKTEVNELNPNVWADKNLGSYYSILDHNELDTNRVAKTLDRSIKIRVYGPEIFTSYNSKVPFGSNDGALWQGRGWNTSLTAGIRAQGYGFSLTFKPQYAVSQNKSFDIMKSANPNQWGYFMSGCDAPQRFGDDTYKIFDWGDTDIRYTWKCLTVGFGTQPVWSGPAQENPVLFSNNAVNFPKFDLGINRTTMHVPYLGWYLGDFEMHYLIGKTTESDFFDTDDSNDHNQYTLFTVSYAPSFLPGLNIGLTKICMNKWGDKFWQYAYPGFYGNTITKGESGEDGKAALTADWLFTKVGLDIYGELGVDDFLSKGVKFYEYARYPWHTVTYTFGLKKSMNVSRKYGLRGMLAFEWNNTEASQDYQMWPGSAYLFGSHYQITQGYTNGGQWLGSGIGYGGNQQKLTFTVYSRHGYEKFIIGRNNPNNNYIWEKGNDDPGTSTTDLAYRYFTAFKANFFVGFENLYYVTKDFSLKFQYMYDLVINPLYDPGISGYGTNGAIYREYNYLKNHHIEFLVKYNF
jgi:hypothetical protein